MSIGLGKMFGFDFLENFNYPYIASSIKDFWRRWHISLSTWFKEYVYIPLGGNRVSSVHVYLNLLIVFFLTGLWHGASYNFVVWGLFHGLFLILERLFLGKLLEKNRLKILNHIYVILVVMIGWVLFRADNLKHSFSILKLMFNYQSSNLTVPLFVFPQAVVCGVIGILFSGILQSKISKLSNMLFNEDRFFAIEIVFQFILLFICIMFLAGNTYNPFIYFRF